VCLDLPDHKESKEQLEFPDLQVLLVNQVHQVLMELLDFKDQ